eukprot:11293113-Karenia_brevis.AAC.1
MKQLCSPRVLHLLLLILRRSHPERMEFGLGEPAMCTDRLAKRIIWGVQHAKHLRFCLSTHCLTQPTSLSINLLESKSFNHSFTSQSDLSRRRAQVGVSNVGGVKGACDAAKELGRKTFWSHS